MERLHSSVLKCTPDLFSIGRVLKSHVKSKVNDLVMVQIRDYLQKLLINLGSCLSIALSEEHLQVVV